MAERSWPVTLPELRRAFAAGQLEPAAVLAAALERSTAREPALNAWRWRLAGPGEAAGAPPPSGSPLACVPVAVKANLACAGRPLDCASRLLADHVATYDASVVARLRRAGALVVGGTNMDEFAMGSSGEHSGFGPTGNPWAPDRVPGGSSSGAAAAVADGQVWAALGSDTGGSVRQPAHCCGLVGLKPTWGRVSRFGLVAFASSLDVVGPLARSVAGCAAVYAVVAGPDPHDATTLDVPVGDPVAAASAAPHGLTVAVADDAALAGVAPAVAEALASARRLLEAAGVRFRTVGIPSPDRALAAYTVLAAAEASANLARFDGTFTGRRRGGDDYDALLRRCRSGGFGPEVKRRILLGTFVLSHGHRQRSYARAVAERHRLARRLQAIWRDVDALLLPVMDTVSFGRGERLDTPTAMARSDRWTVPASLAGLPALTVPVAVDGDGLPVGVQLVGPPLAEETLLRLGGALERATRFPWREEVPWRRR